MLFLLISSLFAVRQREGQAFVIEVHAELIG
jgi:hypothetical protein